MDNKIRVVREHWVDLYNEKMSELNSLETEYEKCIILEIELEIIEQFVKDLDIIG